MANLLGQLSVPGFAGGMFPIGQSPFAIDPLPMPEMQGSAGIDAALNRNAEIGQQMQARNEGGGGLRNILGKIGDAMLVATGGQPIYGPRQQRKKMGQALANYLGNTDAALAEIMAADPETGLALYKMKHGQAEVPSIVREAQYYQSLPEAERQNLERYMRVRFPGMMAPITMGPNDTLEMPNSPAPADDAPTATGPNGEKVRWNGTAWEPMGGPTPQASGSFR